MDSKEEHLDALCRFKVGEFVHHRAHLEALRAEERCNGKLRRYERVGAHPLTIVERLVQQCYGGVQVHYDVRARDAKGNLAVYRLTEAELVPFSDVEDELTRQAKERDE